MTILGINAYTHDVAAAVITQERPVLLLEEERFSQKKHHDGIIFLGMPPYKVVSEILKTHHPDRICHSRTIDHSARNANIAQQQFIAFARDLDPKLKKTHFYNHHLCHAASAFYASPFEKAYICTLDSRGDGLSCSISAGHGPKIHKILEIPERTSLCSIYSYASELLGLGKRKEGSLTGLAACGKINDLLPDLFKWTGYTFQIENLSSLENLAQKSHDFQHKANVALSIQTVFENVILEMLQTVCFDTSITNLALAGGAFLNSALNQRIIDSGRWKNVYIPPAAGDSGTALGAALLALEKPHEFDFSHCFWGSDYTEQDVKAIIQECSLKARKISAEEVAQCIADGQIGAIFDGAMEFGPRALGHRSMVGDPRKKETGDRLNKIKGREWWRPVAPGVLHEHGNLWFNDYEYSPYMTRTFTVKIEMRSRIPAVSHQNGTARLQSVTAEVGFLYQLLQAFHDITHVPMLCNTSFNIKTPIVRTPKQAIATFYTSNLDFLYCQGWFFQKT